MGEAVLRHEAARRGIDIEVDSAGTGAYHIGEDPDYRYTLSTVDVETFYRLFDAIGPFRHAKR